MHPANEGRYDARLLVCHACAAIDRYKRGIEQGDPVEPGARIAVVK